MDCPRRDHNRSNTFPTHLQPAHFSTRAIHMTDALQNEKKDNMLAVLMYFSCVEKLVGCGRIGDEFPYDIVYLLQLGILSWVL